VHTIVRNPLLLAHVHLIYTHSSLPAETLSHASPTACSERLLKGALLGSSGTFDCFTRSAGI
jgi:hypothetical protein